MNEGKNNEKNLKTKRNIMQLLYVCFGVFLRLCSFLGSLSNSLPNEGYILSYTKQEIVQQKQQKKNKETELFTEHK